MRQKGKVNEVRAKSAEKEGGLHGHQKLLKRFTLSLSECWLASITTFCEELSSTTFTLHFQ